MIFFLKLNLSQSECDIASLVIHTPNVVIGEEGARQIASPAFPNPNHAPSFSPDLGDSRQADGPALSRRAREPDPTLEPTALWAGKVKGVMTMYDLACKRRKLQGRRKPPNPPTGRR
jgi:hypothetical protein